MLLLFKENTTQSAGAKEYADSMSAEGYNLFQRVSCIWNLL